MELISLSCNHCGGQLDIPDSTKYITCSYCKSKLEIREKGNAIYSEVLEEAHEKIKELSEELDTVKLEKEIDEFDSEWEKKKDSLMVSYKGKKSIPTNFSALKGLLIIPIGMLLVAAGSDSDLESALVMLFFVGISMISLFYVRKKASEYDEAYSIYKSKRAELTKRRVKLTNKNNRLNKNSSIKNIAN